MNKRIITLDYNKIYYYIKFAELIELRRNILD